MSTQYVKTFYCDSNQNPSNYPSIQIKLITSTKQFNYIKPESYNEMIQSLKSIHDFGDYDTQERLPLIDSFYNNSTNTFNFKEKEQYVTPEYYNNIANSLQLTSTKNKNDYIIGTYFDDLVSKIKNYKIPSTRYYLTQTQCCDCYGECCDSYSCGEGGGGCDGYTCGDCISCDDYYCGGGQ